MPTSCMTVAPEVSPVFQGHSKGLRRALGPRSANRMVKSIPVSCQGHRKVKSIDQAANLTVGCPDESQGMEPAGEKVGQMEESR